MATVKNKPGDSADPGNDGWHFPQPGVTFNGGAGNDVRYGTAGNDRLYGNGGHDLLVGNGGNDLIDGGAGDDTLEGGDGNDEIHDGAGEDTINGGKGHDRIFTGAGFDIVHAGDGNDVIVETGADIGPLPHGDKIFAEAGDDFIDGAAGHDYILGGSGNDTIIGGLGTDTLGGGTGADTFVFRFADIDPHGGAGMFLRDFIGDYEPGVDRLDFRDFAAHAIGGSLFLDDNDGIPGEAGEVMILANNTSVRWVAIDLQGDGQNEVLIEIHRESAQPLSANDFILA